MHEGYGTESLISCDQMFSVSFGRKGPVTQLPLWHGYGFFMCSYIARINRICGMLLVGIDNLKALRR